jgi:hypothetical protein
MLIVRQSTARTVTVGPVLDADGVAVTGGVVGDLKGNYTTGDFKGDNDGIMQAGSTLQRRLRDCECYTTLRPASSLVRPRLPNNGSGQRSTKRTDVGCGRGAKAILGTEYFGAAYGLRVPTDSPTNCWLVPSATASTLTTFVGIRPASTPRISTRFPIKSTWQGARLARRLVPGIGLRPIAQAGMSTRPITLTSTLERASAAVGSVGANGVESGGASMSGGAR